MQKVMACLIFVFLLFTYSSGNAACYGTKNVYSCSDNSGNKYNVQKFGNSTTMRGSNTRTGSQWNQRSTSFGNTTRTTGTTNGRRQTKVWVGSWTFGPFEVPYIYANNRRKRGGQEQG
jgi:hypothetical protein